MYRIMLGEFSHETNSFSAAPADKAAFQRRKMFYGEEAFERSRGEENEMNGVRSVLGQDPSFTLVPSVTFSTGPSGPVSGEMYDLALAEMTRVIREKGPFDGILLNLHGAMVAQGHPDAEGDFLESLRKEAGNEIPIIVSLDLHGNITEKMARLATALIPCEEYPHTDCYETGIAAAELMRDTLEGKCRPTMAYRRIPYLLPLFPTKFQEIGVFLAQARAYQQEHGVRTVRIAHGFFPANIPEMGMSVLAVTDGDQARAEEIAQTLADAIWNARDTLKRHYTPLDEALDMADEELGGPLVLGDGSDNPGAGGLCDTTHVARRILERGITGAAIGVLRDPENVKKCFEAGVGATLSLRVSGMSDARISGGPLAVTGTVVNLCDGQYRNQDEMEKGLLVNMGPTAVLSVAGNFIILTTERCQVLDAEGFRCCGIDPKKQKILVVKSAVHYRQSFGKFAGRLVDLALPGYCAPDPTIFQKLGFRLAGDWE